MQAAILRAYGGIPELCELDPPSAGPGRDTVEVLAAGLNPIDLRIASGGFQRERPELPYVPGKEGVGLLADGTRVYFDRPLAALGTFAERSLIETGAGYPVPDGLDSGVAVALGISGLAAWLALESRARLQPGETVIVLGASGVVGQLAVQIARLLGAGRIVAAARDRARLDRAGELGADALVALDGGDDLPAALRDAAAGGADVVLDPLWGPPAAAALQALRPFGRLINVGESAAAAATLPSAAIRSRTASVLGYTSYDIGDAASRAAYARLAAHAAAGELRVEVEQVALAQLPAAWRRQAGSPGRKLVVVP